MCTILIPRCMCINKVRTLHISIPRYLLKHITMMPIDEMSLCAVCCWTNTLLVFFPQLNILDITTRCELMDYESCPGRERFWEVRGCPAQPQPDLTFSAALPGFSALSSADSGWRMSWMDFCPEEASDRGAPALIALIGSDRAGVLISQPHDPRQQTSVRSGSRLVS